MNSRTYSHFPASSLPIRLSSLPIPLLLLAIGGLWVANLRIVWSLPLLYWFIQYCSAILMIAFIVIPAARSFVIAGQPSVLMLGCGVLMTQIGAAAMPMRGLNAGFAIYNTSVLLSALCHFSGVTITSRQKIHPRRLSAWLTAAYAGSIATMGLVIWGAFAGRMPAFFVNGQGGTLLRSLVIGTAVALFVLTAGQL